MRYGTIVGLDRPVSRIVLGTMRFQPVDDPTVAGAMIEAYVERGGNMLDTANIYGGGRSERAIGEWLRMSGRRDDILLLTKGGHHDKAGKRLTSDEVAFDLGQSLERLGQTRVDLYVLHRDDPAVPVGHIVEALNRHVARGRMSAFGGSNWSPERLRQAEAYAGERDLQPFSASSPNFSLAVPNEPMWPDAVSISGDAAALEWYRRSAMPVLAWSAQAGGFFSGLFSPDFKAETPSDAGIVRVYFSAENWERYRRAEQIGRELGKTGIQVALAWVLSQPALNAFALIGPRTLDELHSSLDAAELELSPGQVRWLNLED